jgi:endonuclease YncB( thermonuclease family)
VDGDTLVCNHQKVRLTNVYAAEMNQPGGSAAKKKLQALVQNREIALRAHGKDRYGRVLAEAFVDGRRIEQADIGPRAGRGSTWGGERHQYVHIVQGKKAVK